MATGELDRGVKLQLISRKEKHVGWPRSHSRGTFRNSRLQAVEVLETFPESLDSLVHRVPNSFAILRQAGQERIHLPEHVGFIRAKHIMIPVQQHDDVRALDAGFEAPP